MRLRTRTRQGTSISHRETLLACDRLRHRHRHICVTIHNMTVALRLVCDILTPASASSSVSVTDARASVFIPYRTWSVRGGEIND